RQGLIGLPVLYNGRRQVGFLPSLVEPFLAANKERVERGSRFTQLSDDEKEDILRRAKRLARVGSGTLTEISRRIARRLGRSPGAGVSYNKELRPPAPRPGPVSHGHGAPG